MWYFVHRFFAKNCNILCPDFFKCPTFGSKIMHEDYYLRQMSLYNAYLTSAMLLLFSLYLYVEKVVKFLLQFSNVFHRRCWWQLIEFQIQASTLQFIQNQLQAETFSKKSILHEPLVTILVENSVLMKHHLST